MGWVRMHVAVMSSSVTFTSELTHHVASSVGLSPTTISDVFVDNELNIARVATTSKDNPAASKPTRAMLTDRHRGKK